MKKFIKTRGIFGVPPQPWKEWHISLIPMNVVGLQQFVVLQPTKKPEIDKLVGVYLGNLGYP